MNRLDADTRARVIGCLIEGCSIRATVRMTGVSKKAVTRLLVDVGEVGSVYQHEVFRNLSCRRLELDELWGWIYCKRKNVTEEIAKKNPQAGDVWLWVGIDADTKLVASWHLGSRDLATAHEFVSDLASRLRHRVQITTDGHKPYLEAIEASFGADVDYAVLQKIYGTDPENERRYSPAKCLGVDCQIIQGEPNRKKISTSYVERQNWSVRTSMRRYTRLSNHAAAVALNYFAYNFIKIHRTLRMTPAMAAGITTKLWEVSDLVVLLEAAESQRAA